MNHVDPYTDFLMTKARPARPLKVVADCSNGPAAIVAESLAKKLALCENPVVLLPMNDSIDPDFSAHGPDPSDPRALTAIAAKIVAERADFGIIFDGDGDRAVFVDENGLAVPPHAVAGFLMESVPGPHVADTLLYQALVHIDPAFKEKVRCSRVGRYFLNKSLRENGAAIGAEFSGHFYFKEFFGADSAAFTLMLMIDLLSKRPGPASEAFSRFASHTVAAAKAPFGRPIADAVEAVKKSLSFDRPASVSDEDGLTIDFGDSWVNMRSSNTEPVVRITAGAGDAIAADRLAREYAALLS